MVCGRTGESLQQFVRAVLDDERITPSRFAELMQLLDAVARSPAFRAAISGGAAQSELSVMRAERRDDRVVVLEGVIDLAVRSETGWQVIDWKSDAADDARWSELKVSYDAQANAYADILKQVTGLPATASVERVRAF